jgi:alanyl-tRNA synthetase
VVRPTARLYRDDPYLLEFDAHVTARAEHDGRTAVVLDRTAFYAESGGQPWDTGWLQTASARVAVVAVLDHEGALLHVLDSDVLAAGEAVRGHVDAERRLDHRQQHHGQHLLSRAFVDTAGARTVSFHLGARDCSIDLDREVAAPQVSAAVRRANEVVWEARPVSVRTLSRGDASRLGVTVPHEAGDEVRLVEAEGFDLQPCGGTHPRNTAEVGLVLPLGHERYKAGSRVRFVCGHRALAVAAGQGAALREAGALLSSGPDGVTAAVARLQEQLAEAAHQARALQARLLDVEAERMIAEARTAGDRNRPLVIARVLEGCDAAALRQLAGRLTEGSGCVALLAGRTATGHLVFARSEDVGLDVAALLQTALLELGGKGGGRGRMAQGGCPGTSGLDAALARAAAAAQGGPAKPEATR